MEYHVDVAGQPPRMDALREAVEALDPAAVIDLVAGGQLVRVAGMMDAAELVQVLGAAGVAVKPAQVTQLPSVCCGGCSG